MPTLSRRRTLLRWMFLGIGLLLLFGGSALLQATFQSEAEAFFPEDVDRQNLFVSVMAVVNLAAATLSLITAWALKRSRPWERWTGICVSLLLIAMFPWMTLAGLFGLFTLTKNPPAPEKVENPATAALARKSKDYWIAKKRSKAQGWAIGILAAVGMTSFGGVGIYAEHLKMHGWNLGWIFLPVLFLIDVTVHESGHAIVAWALYNRLRAVNIGPFTFRDFGRGYQFHFDWRRLFATGGFVSSAPTTGANLRFKFIAEVAGGPLAALLNALIMTAIFLSLPGTRFEAMWWFPGFLAPIAFFDFVVNLIPFGYCDGSMLFHLIFMTHGGRLLLNRNALTKYSEDAMELRNRADYRNEAALWSKALEEALACGEQNALVVAICYERQGRVSVALGDWPSAEEYCRKALTFEAECAFENALAVNSWALLQRAALERHHIMEVGRSYPPLLRALEDRRKKIRDRVELGVTSIMLGRAHARAADFGKALEEARTAIRVLPPGPERSVLFAEAWSIQAQAELALGDVGNALASVAQAEEMLRSPDLPSTQRHVAWDEFGQIGEDLWRQGESQVSLDILSEVIARLQSYGATDAAARYQIKLAGAQRELGNLEDAWKCLPEDRDLPISHLRSLLLERARLHLAGGRPEAAIRECECLIPLWESEPERAITQGVLAEACLELNDFAQAASLARQAADILGPWHHYESAACLVTLAIAEWKSGSEWEPLYANEAHSVIQSDVLLRPAAKARLLESQISRLKRHGRQPELLHIAASNTPVAAAAVA
ncbi:MAG TPA: site-2 protease family protein [Bryobacteraceae bacterium]|nr:site-2 protease family protein [Bryobacteraceae bacterium]